MSDIFKIAGVGLMGGIAALTLRKDKPEFALLISLVTSLIIAGEILLGVSGVIDSFYEIIASCGVEIKYFSLCIKAVGMAYISQFASDILRDCGEGAVASKVEAAGKVAILVLTIPVLEAFLRLALKVVRSV